MVLVFILLGCGLLDSDEKDLFNIESKQIVQISGLNSIYPRDVIKNGQSYLVGASCRKNNNIELHALLINLDENTEIASYYLLEDYTTIHAIVKEREGYYLAIAKSRGRAGFSLIRLTEEGEILSEAYFSSRYGRSFYKMVKTQDNGVVVIENSSLVNGKALIVKFNSELEAVWEKQITDEENEGLTEVHDVLELENANLIVFGATFFSKSTEKKSWIKKINIFGETYLTTYLDFDFDGRPAYIRDSFAEIGKGHFIGGLGSMMAEFDTSGVLLDSFKFKIPNTLDGITVGGILPVDHSSFIVVGTLDKYVDYKDGVTLRDRTSIFHFSEFGNIERYQRLGSFSYITEITQKALFRDQNKNEILTFGIEKEKDDGDVEMVIYTLNLD